jgi:hypothetical protein
VPFLSEIAETRTGNVHAMRKRDVYRILVALFVRQLCHMDALLRRQFLDKNVLSIPARIVVARAIRIQIGVYVLCSLSL